MLLQYERVLVECRSLQESTLSYHGNNNVHSFITSPARTFERSKYYEVGQNRTHDTSPSLLVEEGDVSNEEGDVS